MKAHFLAAKQFVVRYANILFFVGGFIFDTFTLVRIDSVLDLVLQAVYLAGVTLLVILGERAHQGAWVPSGLIRRVWHFETEALHFLYGGLLSAYVIFYFKSTSFTRSLIFFSVVLVLMFANEMPQVRRAGSMMRLGLYAFCTLSFLNYLIPVLVGRMGWPIFLVGWSLSVVITVALVKHLSKLAPDPKKAFRRLGLAPGAVCALILFLYAAKLIPPVPLSVQYVGIFQNVERDGGKYRLSYAKPPWFRFWQHDARPFVYRDGDSMNCFVRVFAPRRFHHQVFVRWSVKNPLNGQWQTSDRVPLPISGGRDQGFRGTTTKQNFSPGVYRVEIETDDGRTLASRQFQVRRDESTDERTFKSETM